MSTAAQIYEGLADDAVVSVRDAATRIRLRMSRTAADIIEIGRDLIEVKRSLGHGGFLPWIHAEFGMSEWSARRFMDAAEHFKSSTVPDLPPSVLYALAAPSTPEPVRKEVLRRVEAGEKVTSQEVLDLKRKLKAAEITAKEERSLRSATDHRVTEVAQERDRIRSENAMLKSQVQQLHARIEEPVSAPAPEIKPVDTTLEALRALWRSAGSTTRQAFLADVTEG